MEDALDTISKLGPVATGLAAVVALVVGLVAWRQRQQADRLAEWWRRTQWALDRALSPDPGARVVGLDVLALQATSVLASPEDLRLLRGLTLPRLPDVPEGFEPELVGPDEQPHVTEVPNPTTPDREPVRPQAVGTLHVTREQVAAARLLLVADARLGEPTPPWVQRVAALG